MLFGRGGGCLHRDSCDLMTVETSGILLWSCVFLSTHAEATQNSEFSFQLPFEAKMMKVLRLYSASLLLAFAKANSAALVSDHTLQHRELFLNLGFCDGIEIQEEFFECGCNAQLFLPSLTATCSPPGGEPLCPLPDSEIICGVPELRFGISLTSIFRLFQGQLPFFAGLCYTDISIAGFVLPPFINEVCIDFANPQQPFTGPLSFLNPRNAPRISSEAASQTYSLCSMTIDGESCEVCEPCNDGNGGTGVSFSCLDGALVSDGCTSVATTPLPTSFSDPNLGDLLVLNPAVSGSS